MTIAEAHAELAALLDCYRPLHMSSNEADWWQWSIDLFDDVESLVAKLQAKAGSAQGPKPDAGRSDDSG